MGASSGAVDTSVCLSETGTVFESCCEPSSAYSSVEFAAADAASPEWTDYDVYDPHAYLEYFVGMTLGIFSYEVASHYGKALSRSYLPARPVEKIDLQALKAQKLKAEADARRNNKNKAMPATTNTPNTPTHC